MAERVRRAHRLIISNRRCGRLLFQNHQRQAAKALQTDHHELRCSVDDIARVFPDVLWHAETPLTRTAPAPLFLLAKLARERGCKVVLTL